MKFISQRLKEKWNPTRPAPGFDTTCPTSSFGWPHIDFLMLMILGIAAVMWSRAVGLYFDLDCFDEPAVYLGRGLHLRENPNFLLDLQGSPLYTAFYFLLSLIQGDPLKLYYLCGRLLALGLPLLFYGWLRSERLGYLASCIGALLLLFYAPLVTFNRWPSNFGMAVVLAECILLARFPAKRYLPAVFALSFLVASLARPEYFTVFAIAAPLAAYTYGLSFRHSRFRERLLGGLLLLLCGVGGILYLKLMAQGLEEFDKPFSTFRDFNYWRIGSERGYSAGLSRAEVFSQLFGPTTSIRGAFRANPGEFLRHMSYSAGKIGRFLFELLSSYRYFFRAKLGAVFFATLSALMLGQFLIYGKESRKSRAPRRIFYLMLGAQSLPFVLSGVLVGTVPRYLTPVIIAFIAAIVSFVRIESWRWALSLAIAAVIAVGIASPDLSADPILRPWLGAREPDLDTRPFRQPALSAVLLARELPLTLPIRFFALHDQTYRYLSQESQGLDLCWNGGIPCPPDYQMNENGLRTLLSGEKINLIFINESFRRELARMSRGKLRAEIEEFSKYPEHFGFRKFDVPCSEDSVFALASALPTRAFNAQVILQSVRGKIRCLD